MKKIETMKSIKQESKDLKIETMKSTSNKDFVKNHHELMYNRLEKLCEPLFRNLDHEEFIRVPKNRALAICDIMRVEIEFLIDEFETMTVWKRETFMGWDTILKFHKEDDYEVWSNTIEKPSERLHDYVQRIYPIKTMIKIKNLFTTVKEETCFAFGRYKGISVKTVNIENPAYIEWAKLEIERFEEEIVIFLQ
jgi:hypothetical protein